MADTLQQNVQVNLQGSGNLTGTLKDAGSAADSTSRSVKSVRDAVKDLHGVANIPTSVRANAGGWGAGGSQGGSIAALGGDKAPSVADVTSRMRASMDTGQSLTDRMRTAWQANVKAEEDMARAKLKAQTAVISSLQRQKEDEEAKSRAHAMLLAGGLAYGGYRTVKSTASLANPWAGERFDKAARDFSAVIGRELVPWLDRATRVVRFMADAFTALPAPVRTVIGVGIAATTVLGGTAIAIAATSRAYTYVTTTARAATSALLAQAQANIATARSAGVIGTIGKLGPGGILAALGITALTIGAMSNAKGGSSYGAAPGGSGITSSEGYLAELQTDSLKAQSLAQRQLSVLEEILSVLQLKGGGVSQLAQGVGLSEKAGNVLGEMWNVARWANPATPVWELQKWFARQFD